jgi:hypothetical protein
MYSRVEDEDERLSFHRSAKHNEASKHWLYTKTETTNENTDDFSLSASFMGSPKYYTECTANALAFSQALHRMGGTVLPYKVW